MVKLWDVILQLVFLICTYARPADPDALGNCESWKYNPNDRNFPSPEEISRAFTFKGAPGWGHQMRKEKSVRLLCIGGSQTAEAIPSAMVPLLDLWLKRNISSDSYALNRGKGSTPPQGFIGNNYDWEDWETSKWPNVMMIDFTLNSMVVEGQNCVKAVDKIIRGINQKYLAKDLPIPDVYLVNYILLRGFYVESQKNSAITFDQAFQRYNNLSTDPQDNCDYGNGFNRGCATCQYYESFAQFYGYPIISYRDATWPAFSRFHLANPNRIWRFSSDSIHLSDWARWFQQQYLFAPFFTRAMTPRDEDVKYKRPSKWSHLYEHDLRMFAPELTIKEIARWSSWGNERNTLRKVISPHVQNNIIATDHDKHEGEHRTHHNWHFTSTPGHKHDRGHICYGSKKENTIVVFDIPAPTACDATPCAVQLSTIYSWNSTHFGTMECSVYRNITSDKESKQELLVTVAIQSQIHNNIVIRNTLPLDTVLHKNITAGNYQIHCKKTDEKHSCISAVQVHQEFIF